ncbi:MAG: DUF4957 domain-containing protein [Lewinellaceae bacterium]|nr:DUF4957 domain-containing protein [Lewinellaceae bacterium]
MISNTYRFMGKYIFLLFFAVLFSCSKDDIVYEQTRLFRPALNTDLTAKGNTILVNLAKSKDAVSYTIDVSQDSFKTIEYNFTVDTNNFVIDKALIGEDLLYNTLYQLRATANASSSEFNSKVAELGSVRTERFASIILLPRAYDVTDVKARVRWSPAGAAVTEVKTFSSTDIKLANPISSYPVSASENADGEVIIDGLSPSTQYQVAIYSGAILRGWVDYTTLVAGVDVNDPKVVNLSDSEDPDAFTAAVLAAQDGGIILLKKGVRYNIPIDLLNKSLTIKGAYGLTPDRAALFSTSDWKVEVGANIDHVNFDDIEFIGEDMAGDYVFNISNAGAQTIINTVSFNNCEIHNLRGVLRLRSDSFVRNFTINDCVVYNFGNYGIFTCDTDGDNQAAIDNVMFTNSTFYQLTVFVTSRQNVQSFLIDGCTFSEFTQTAQQTFRFRGADGKNNIINGLTISNSIFGHGWDIAGAGDKSINFNKDGLKGTSITLTNTWATSDFAVIAGSEMPGFPSATYSGTATKLWKEPYTGDFNFSDNGFAGKFDSGDPRWRVK